jgi:hypothetical protein
VRSDLPEVLAHLIGPDGAALADTAIEQLLDAAATATAHPAARLATLSGPVQLCSIRAEAVAHRFEFDPDPRPAPGEPEC